MRIAEPLDRILQAALDRRPPCREECVYLLNLPTESLEARILMSVADAVSRQRFADEAMLLGQIPLGRDDTPLQNRQRRLEQIVGSAQALTGGDDLHAVFLLATHGFDPDCLLGIVEAVRAAIPIETQIVVDVDDLTLAHARQLQAAGVQGACHACWSRQASDMDPSHRKESFRTIRDAELDFYYCCPPVGPEHSNEELVEQIFLGIDYGCLQHAAMRRVAMPGRPVSGRGQITQLRLAQVVAVVALASLGCDQTESIAVHEPNLLGLTAGANVVYAEIDVEGGKTQPGTSTPGSLDVTGARRMLYEAGFTALRRGDGSCRALDPP